MMSQSRMVCLDPSRLGRRVSGTPLLRVTIGITSPIWPNFGQVRNRGSKAAKKIALTYQLALCGHNRYLKRLKHPTEVHEVDPSLLPYKERVQSVFSRRSKIHEKNKINLNSATLRPFVQVVDNRGATRTPKSVLTHQWPNFGTISVYHSSPFRVHVDLLMIPIIPNFLPQAGIGKYRTIANNAGIVMGQ